MEGQVGHLLAQRDLVADVARGDQQLVGLAGHPVAQDRGLDVPPGPVGGPDPDREPTAHLVLRGLRRLVRLTRCGLTLRGPGDLRGLGLSLDRVVVSGLAERGPGGPHGRQQVFGVDQFGQTLAGQFVRVVAEVADRRAGVADPSVQIGDQDHVAGPVGQFAQAAAGVPPDPQHGAGLPDQHQHPGHQDQQGRAAGQDHGQARRAAGHRHRQRRVGVAHDLPDQHDQGGHGHGQRGDHGGPARADDPAGAGDGARQPPHLGHVGPRYPGGEPEQNERQYLGHLLGPGRVPGRQPGPHAERVAHADREQGQVGQADPAPGRGQRGQQHAQHSRVHQRVDQAEQEGAGPLAGVPVVGPEQRHPADDQQRDGHDVAVGQRGQDRARVRALGGDR